ncbi:flagellar motor switch protein FliG [Lutimaribacter sp. EGI FJ00015]|uniref:Flagellar motor switch protein FliG n=1 Tax=Lutimaribacter degradans TaxID=2945989 RepID=A0ACC5ZT36_9RHOB|nr:FliG C-terminal domain-containing protein [Lutimaribacter sp. EGI FJ00013]MCM2560990.1 flagellar motor switch protein FliG [Lutimaribacter sp. EGI FJ00013]MCO0612063.1 flagellar motor switch protein FliG [Lutimaribacter sp. EGI FJ00015]MCO0634817.1 flagellar motor switch protein FliG [Lutimaribacter sp. EGI FJ00014]
MTQLTPFKTAAPGPERRAPHLTRRQKAAIVVRFLLSEGAPLTLSGLPDDLQAALTQQLGRMRVIDRKTLADVIAEFADELEQIGLSFPRGLLGALSELDGKISDQTAARLRREAGVRQLGDPWDRIRALDVAQIQDLIDREATEVAAVVLSKLDTPKAAELLGTLPGDRARLLTFAISQTEAVTPDAVYRIGLSLATQLDDTPEKAFGLSPERRIGAILNLSPAATRDALLDGLAQDDSAFADQVRKVIFTFPDIPQRVAPIDVPGILRSVDQPILLTALRFSTDLDGPNQAAAAHLLENISKRMADGLRDEMAELPPVRQKPGEEAQNAVIATIRRLEDAGEITLLASEEEEES